MFIINLANVTDDCNHECKCRPGKASNGGQELNSDGYCEHFCSLQWECGNGIKHLEGRDCTKCVNDKFVPKGVYRVFHMILVLCILSFQETKLTVYCNNGFHRIRRIC